MQAGKVQKVQEVKMYHVRRLKPVKIDFGRTIQNVAKNIDIPSDLTFDGLFIRLNPAITDLKDKNEIGLALIDLGFNERVISIKGLNEEKLPNVFSRHGETLAEAIAARIGIESYSKPIKRVFDLRRNKIEGYTPKQIEVLTTLYLLRKSVEKGSILNKFNAIKFAELFEALPDEGRNILLGILGIIEMTKSFNGVPDFEKALANAQEKQAVPN
jgi:hypothetical protein